MMKNHKALKDNSTMIDNGIKTLIIDVSVMVRKTKHRPQKSQKTFGEYGLYLKNLIEDEFSQFDRIDIMVFDQYFTLSIKTVTRAGRVGEEHGKRYHVQENTPLPDLIGMHF